MPLFLILSQFVKEDKDHAYKRAVLSVPCDCVVKCAYNFYWSTLYNRFT